MSLKRVSIRKVKRTDHPADVVTKHLRFEDIEKHL